MLASVREERIRSKSEEEKNWRGNGNKRGKPFSVLAASTDEGELWPDICGLSVEATKKPNSDD